MNAPEEIETAIKKLTELKSNASEFQFTVEESLGVCYLGSFRIADSNDPSSILEEDARLITTLHDTIDAQLKILRHVGTYYSGDLGISTNRLVVDLARAINGS